MRWMTLAFWIVLCFGVAGVSGSLTAAEIPNWYRTLVRPSIAPPDWVFGPVWTLLYALMAVAAWKVSLLPGSSWRTAALALFVLQLALNFCWTLVFFRWHQPGWALAEVLMLWLALLLTSLTFVRISAVAFWLMMPYLGWVTFASILNAAFWRLNKGSAM